MIKAFFLSFSLFLTASLSAQIENEIFSYVDSTNMMIVNGRKMIKSSILNNDLDKVEEAYKYLTNKREETKKQPLYLNEELGVLYLLKDWQGLSKFTADFRARHLYTPLHKLEYFGYIVVKEVAERYEAILADLNQANIPNEQKDFFKLVLYAMKYDSSDEKYVAMYDKFQENYPNSASRDNYQVFLSKPPVPMSYSIFMGPSVGFPAGKTNRYKNLIGGYMGMDININRLYFSLFFVGGALWTSQDFTLEKDGEVYDFEKGEELSFFKGGISLGYFLKRTKNFHLAPSLSLLKIRIDTDKFKTDEENDDDLVLVEGAIISPGLHTEMKIASFKVKNFSSSEIIYDSYVSLKIDLSYSYPLKSRFAEMQQGFLIAKAGLVWGFGDF